MHREVVIIGAGLVGSLWAYILKQRGFNVTIFEKRSDPKLQSSPAGRSINLVITSRGLRGLEVAGLLKTILPITVPVYGRQIHAKSGETLFQPYGRDKTECNYSISRWELNKALIAACVNEGIQIYFDHSVQDIDPISKILAMKSPNGPIKKSYELLFATDGAGSVVRKSLIEKIPTEFSESVDWLESDYKELNLPSLNGLPAIEKNSLHIWPRGTHMMMGLANADNSFTMTLYLPKTNHPFSFSNLNSEKDVSRLFESEFPDAANLIPDYAKDFLKHPQGKLATVRFNRWNFQDSIAFLGDAAHAIVPFFGQGMNLGFEDCTTLLRLFDESPHDWNTILKKYDTEQRPNADAIAEMALENFVEMRDKVGDTQFQFKKKLEGLIEKNFPDLYRSRYGLITYTLTPYKLAKEVGAKQSLFLEKISQGLKDPSELDLDLAKKKLQEDLEAWMISNQIKTHSYKPTI